MPMGYAVLCADRSWQVNHRLVGANSKQMTVNYQCMPFKGGAMLVMDDMTELAGMQTNLISHQERLSAFNAHLESLTADESLGAADLQEKMTRLAAEMHSVTKGDLERLLESVHRSIATEEVAESVQPNLSGLDEGLESYLLSEYSRAQPRSVRKLTATSLGTPAPRTSMSIGAGAATVLQVQLSSHVFDWAKLDEWGVDPYLYSDDELIDILLGMVERLNLITTCHIRPAKLAKFLQTVRSYYHVENAYHNFKHAFCVAHMIYLALFRFQFRLHFSEEEVHGDLDCSRIHRISAAIVLSVINDPFLTNRCSASLSRPSATTSTTQATPTSSKSTPNPN